MSAAEHRNRLSDLPPELQHMIIGHVVHEPGSAINLAYRDQNIAHLVDQFWNWDDPFDTEFLDIANFEVLRVNRFRLDVSDTEVRFSSGIPALTSTSTGAILTPDEGVAIWDLKIMFEVLLRGGIWEIQNPVAITQHEVDTLAAIPTNFPNLKHAAFKLLNFGRPIDASATYTRWGRTLPIARSPTLKDAERRARVFQLLRAIEGTQWNNSVQRIAWCANDWRYASSEPTSRRFIRPDKFNEPGRQSDGTRVKAMDDIIREPLVRLKYL